MATQQMKLSPNFSLAEFTATSHKVDNIPTEEQIKAMALWCMRIGEPIRARFKSPVIITSGFRSPALNKLVGGAPTSQHLKGEAADISVRGVANVEVFKWIANELDFDQLIAEKLSKRDGQKGWCHVSINAKHNRNEALSFLGHGIYSPGLIYVD